jgi:hypothetical protein
VTARSPVFRPHRQGRSDAGPAAYPHVFVLAVEDTTNAPYPGKVYRVKVAP